jgi:hypothetical protein
MKKQINKLIALAEDYARTGKELQIDFNHNYIRVERNVSYRDTNYATISEGKEEIRLYFDDSYPEYDKWALYYGRDIEVIGYSNSIRLPFDVSAASLNAVIEDLESHIKEFKSFKSKAKEIARNKKLAKIENLEAQIKELKA